jgi:hypothetical protein
MTIIPIDIINKTPHEAVEEMKRIAPELFEEAAKRPKVKRDKFILQVGIESDLDLMDLRELIVKILKPYNDNDTFKGMTWGALTQYEKIEFCVTHVEGTNNGSGCNFWMEKGNPESD